MNTSVFEISLLTSALAFAPLLQNVPAEAQVTDYGPFTCIQGYVWREAVPGDLVCVTPEIRSQAAYDNSQASVRKSPVGGLYGNTVQLSRKVR